MTKNHQQITTDNYPFSLVALQGRQNCPQLLVKRNFAFRQQSIEQFLQKMNIVRTLKHPYLMDVLQVNHRPPYVDLFYTPLPNCLADFHSRPNRTLLPQLLKQLCALSHFLKENHILTTFTPENCGLVLDQLQEWQLKYYLPISHFNIVSCQNELQRSHENFLATAQIYLSKLESRDWSRPSCANVSNPMDKQIMQRCKRLPTESTEVSSQPVHALKMSYPYVVDRPTHRKVSTCDTVRFERTRPRDTTLSSLSVNMADQHEMIEQVKRVKGRSESVMLKFRMKRRLLKELVDSFAGQHVHARRQFVSSKR